MSTDGTQKVSVYSINDLKNATDDALTPYLTTLPPPQQFRKSDTYTNVRLAVGYTTVAIAGALFYFDYKLGWEKTKDATLAACVVYFVLNGFLTFWIWKLEAGKVFVGVREGGQKLTLSSSVEKYKPVYKLQVKYEAPSGKKWEDKKIEAPFRWWFSSDGIIQVNKFKEWLASEIEPIALADPSSAKVAQSIDSSSLGEAIVVGDREASASLATATPSSKNRKGKKKA